MTKLKEPPFIQSIPPDGSLPWSEWLRDVAKRINERLALSGTTDEITITDNGNGTGTISLPSSIKLDGATALRLLATDASKKTVSVANLASWIAGVADETDVTDDGDGTITIGIVNPLIVGKGGTGAATLTDHGILLGSGTGALTPLGVASNGQIPIGSAGADPVVNEIDGTANQIIVINGAGTITLSAPQDLHTAANPTFAIPNLTGLKIVTGANAYMDTATLVAGTVTVNNNHVKATSLIWLAAQDNNTTGALRVSARIVDTSFTITSSNAGDTGVVAWVMVDPV